MWHGTYFMFSIIVNLEIPRGNCFQFWITVFVSGRYKGPGCIFYESRAQPIDTSSGPRRSVMDRRPTKETLNRFFTPARITISIIITNKNNKPNRFCAIFAAIVSPFFFFHNKTTSKVKTNYKHNCQYVK